MAYTSGLDEEKEANLQANLHIHIYVYIIICTGSYFFGLLITEPSSGIIAGTVYN